MGRRGNPGMFGGCKTSTIHARRTRRHRAVVSAGETPRELPGGTHGIHRRPRTSLRRGGLSEPRPDRVALVALAAVLAVVAWRRRLDRPIVRHPGRAAVGTLAVLVVAGPLGWYLGSPLVLSTTIDEPPPVAAADPTPAPSAANRTPAAVSTPAANVASPASRPSATPEVTPIRASSGPGRSRAPMTSTSARARLG